MRSRRSPIAGCGCRTPTRSSAASAPIAFVVDNGLDGLFQVRPPARRPPRLMRAAGHARAWPRACRLIPTRYPSVGLFDRVADAGDLDAVIELETWTNDRISNELGLLHTIPQNEWVTGRPMASVVMAAFCHPAPGGARFSDERRGAWYAGRTLATALANRSTAAPRSSPKSVTSTRACSCACTMRISPPPFTTSARRARLCRVSSARLVRTLAGVRARAPGRGIERHRLPLGAS